MKLGNSFWSSRNCREFYELEDEINSFFEELEEGRKKKEEGRKEEGRKEDEEEE